MQPDASVSPSFHNKTIVISGASRGIGAAMALAFARRGGRLVLGYRQESEEKTSTDRALRETGSEPVWVQGDISDPLTARALCDAALAINNRVDVAIANAGISHFAPFPNITDDELDRLIRVNQYGVYYLLREAGRSMKQQRGGVVLSISSVVTSRVPRMYALYAGTRAFVEALTRGFAVEYAAHGIRANVLAPGFTRTDMNRVLLAAYPESVAASSSFGRIAEPHEIAAMAVFLCSDEASYVSGQVIPVDGVSRVGN